MFENDPEHRTLRASIAGAVALTLLSLVLGYAGYRTMGLEPLDAFFGTLQMFALDAPRDLAADSVPIGIARFTAPLALAVASAVAVMAIAGETVRHFLRLRRVRGHVVVLGLSDGSIEFVQALLDERRPVAIVEVDGDHSRLPAMKRAGALVVVGDASRETTQRMARVERSSRVVVSTGDDGRNLRSAETAARMMDDSTENTVHVLLRDYWLHEELARTEFMANDDDGPVIDFVHRADYEAAAFVEAVTTASRASLESDVIVFHGSGERGRRTLIHLARRNLLLGLATPIVVDEETRSSVVDPALAEAPWLSEAMGGTGDEAGSAGACIVADSGLDGAALGRGLRLAQAHPDAEVFVLTDFPAGESLLQRNAAIRVVPAGSVALSPSSLFSHSWVDTFARARHQIYCALEVQRGTDPSANSSLVPWADLPEPLRESNRDFARAVSGVLSQLPVRLAPLRGLPDDKPRLSEEHMEQLARNEHDRWMSDLERKGWRWAPAPKDPEKQTHPLLVDWSALAEEEREKDRDSIRSIPTMLALVGLELQSV